MQNDVILFRHKKVKTGNKPQEATKRQKKDQKNDDNNNNNNNNNNIIFITTVIICSRQQLLRELPLNVLSKRDHYDVIMHNGIYGKAFA